MKRYRAKLGLMGMAKGAKCFNVGSEVNIRK